MKGVVAWFKENLPLWNKALFKSVSPGTLAIFRIIFGLLMAQEYLSKYAEHVDAKYLPGMFHFTYPLFTFLEPWGGDGMYYHLIVVGVASLFLALGLFFLVLLEAPSLSFHGPLLGTLELAFLRIGSQFAAQILFGTVFLGVFGRGVLAFFVLAQLETQRLDDWGLFQRLIFHF